MVGVGGEVNTEIYIDIDIHGRGPHAYMNEGGKNEEE